MKYIHIKENLINRFLNPRYRWSVGISKKFIINHINENCPFPTTSHDDNDELIVDLGDDVVLNIKLIWEEKVISPEKNIIHYKLMKFE